MNLRPTELIIILVIVLLVFGAKKLPDLARSLGASAKEFRKGIEDGTEQTTETQATDSHSSDTKGPDVETPGT